MNVFQCDLCSFSTPRSFNVRSHKISVHSDLRPWKCTHPGCNFEAKLKQNLKQHLRLHETSLELRKPHVCTFTGCDYRASNKTALKSHVDRRHTTATTKNFSCTLCPLKFYSKFELNAHIRRHVKERCTSKCSYCNYRTHDGWTLRAHFRNVHKPIGTFTCSSRGCKFRTNYKSSLTRHLNRHKPSIRARNTFLCTFPQCEHRARDRHALSTHMHKRHNPDREKEFQCPFCPQTYHSLAVVNWHVHLLSASIN